jgi:hypothetical protein
MFKVEKKFTVIFFVIALVIFFNSPNIFQLILSISLITTIGYSFDKKNISLRVSSIIGLIIYLFFAFPLLTCQAEESEIVRNPITNQCVYFQKTCMDPSPWYYMQDKSCEVEYCIEKYGKNVSEVFYGTFNCRSFFDMQCSNYRSSNDNIQFENKEEICQEYNAIWEDLMKGIAPGNSQ